MQELILHHYAISLFSEKIRCILAYKKLPWRSVEQPSMMPKPQLMPLTGGYRKIPVLQIGADVYCDSSLIARRIEQLHPDPPCIPLDDEALIGIVEEWADHRFTSQVVPSVIAELLPAFPSTVLDDRARRSPMISTMMSSMMSSMMSKQSIEAMAPHTHSQALLSLDLLEHRLSGQPFLVGNSFTLADAACYHPLWFMRHVPKLYEAVLERPAISNWVNRIAAFGPGRSTPMAASEALEIARLSSPLDLAPVEHQTGDGPAVGETVAIRADDIGVEQVRGVVVRVTPDEIAIRHHDPLTGEIAVHFPRSGYVIQK